MRRLQLLSFVLSVTLVASRGTGQTHSLVRVDTAPTFGADYTPDFRQTHTTYDLWIDTPADWLTTELSADVVGDGIIWNASDEQTDGDPSASPLPVGRSVRTRRPTPYTPMSLRRRAAGRLRRGSGAAGPRARIT